MTADQRAMLSKEQCEALLEVQGDGVCGEWDWDDFYGDGDGGGGSNGDGDGSGDILTWFFVSPICITLNEIVDLVPSDITDSGLGTKFSVLLQGPEQ